ncbi:MAG: NAD(P)H-dependent oxidoreductase [Cytophagales bacterium]|nr:NAD(P)H-dependent oxidoreductase [Cytophagales bacterium]
MDIIEKLQWRYATKKFDPTKKLSEEQVNRLLHAINLTPTSMGMQVYSVVVVEDPEVRAKLRAASNNQAQVTDASHFLLFVRPAKVTDDWADAHAQNIINIRGVAPESVEGFRNSMKNIVSKLTDEKAEVWTSKQIYIALGVLMTACAAEGIDACPMEGFNAHQYDEILGLPALGYHAVVAAPIGYRSVEDKYATLPKVRKPLEKLVIRI